MFQGKLEPGDRAEFTNEAKEYRAYSGKPCTVRTVDSHTTVVVFDDGYRMCVYVGELKSLNLADLYAGIAKTAMSSLVCKFDRAIMGATYGETHDEGSLA
jgi:hypothetical protein